MVNLKDNLRFQNVISKSYYEQYSELNKCFKSFEEELKNEEIMVKGPFFVAINDFDESGPVDIELFVPVYSSRKVPEGMKFHSYYSVEKMASSVVKNDIDENVLPNLYMVNATINSIGCKVISPIYLVYENLFNQSIITIKMAYAKDGDNEKQE